MSPTTDVASAWAWRLMLAQAQKNQHPAPLDRAQWRILSIAPSIHIGASIWSPRSPAMKREARPDICPPDGVQRRTGGSPTVRQWPCGSAPIRAAQPGPRAQSALPSRCSSRFRCADLRFVNEHARFGVQRRHHLAPLGAGPGNSQARLPGRDHSLLARDPGADELQRNAHRRGLDVFAGQPGQDSAKKAGRVSLPARRSFRAHGFSTLRTINLRPWQVSLRAHLYGTRSAKNSDRWRNALHPTDSQGQRNPHPAGHARPTCPHPARLRAACTYQKTTVSASMPTP